MTIMREVVSEIKRGVATRKYIRYPVIPKKKFLRN